MTHQADTILESVRGCRLLNVSLRPDLQPALQRAMQALGKKGYLEVDWLKTRRAPKEIMSAVKRFKPDLTFCQIQVPRVIFPKTFHGATGVVVNWTGDVLRPLPQWYIDVGREIHWTLFSNQTDVDTARAAGINSTFLNIGFDERVYTPEGPKADVPDIIFLGNSYKPKTFDLVTHRADMVKALCERYGNRFRLYGMRWGKHVQSLMYNSAAESAAYRGCKIAINQNHFDYDRFSSDRLLRAMGCGAYVVSNHYPNLEKDFTPGKHLAAWKTFDDLFREIDWALEHEEERKAIADAGSRLVHEKHTWAAKILELIEITGVGK